MTRNEANQHLIKARQTINGWEALGKPFGKAEDVLRMIGEELAILEQIIVDHPTKAETVGNLIVRYRAMGNVVKRGAH